MSLRALKALSPPGGDNPRSFAQDALLTFGAKGLLLVISFCSSVVVARSLGPEARGLFAAGAALAALGSQLSNIGAHAFNTFEVSKRPHHLGSLLANSAAQTAVTGGGVAFLLAGVFTLEPAWAPVSGQALILSLAWIPCALSAVLLQSLILGMQWVGFYNLVEVGARAFGLALLLLLAARSLLDVSTALIVSIAVVAGMTLVMWLRLRAAKGSESGLSMELIRQGLGYGVRSYIVAFLAYTVMRSDILLIKYMLGPTQTGYYSIATTLADVVYLGPISINAILFPRFAAMTDPEAKWRLLRKVVLVVAGLVFLICAGVGLYARTLIGSVFGVDYLPAAPALAVLMPGIVFLAVTSVVSAFIASIDIPPLLIGVYVAANVVNIGVNVTLIPVFGISGASLASSVAYFVCMVGAIWVALKLRAREDV